MTLRPGGRLPLYMTRPAVLLFCDARRLPPDLDTVDALARMQIAAARLGLELRLRECPPQLRAVIAFAGLDEVLSCSAAEVAAVPAPTSSTRPRRRSG